MIGDIEGFANRELAIVEYSAGGGRFFGFAFGAPPRMGCFTRTRIGVTAFAAGKSVRPLESGEEFEAGFIALKKQFQFLFGQAFTENSAHSKSGVFIKSA